MLHHRVRFCCLLLPLREHATIIERHDFDDFLLVLFPAIQDLLCSNALGKPRMSRDEILDELFFLRVFQSFQVDHFQIAALREIALLVENVGDAAAHTGRKVASGAAKNDHPPAVSCTPVIADTFDNSNRSAVSNREPLAGAANVRFRT